MSKCKYILCVMQHAKTKDESLAFIWYIIHVFRPHQYKAMLCASVNANIDNLCKSVS